MLSPEVSRTPSVSDRRHTHVPDTIEETFMVTRFAAVIFIGVFALNACGAAPPTVSIQFSTPPQDHQMARFACGELQDHLAASAGIVAEIVSGAPASPAGTIRMAVDPRGVAAAGPAGRESFRIVARQDGSLAILGADAAGLLWGVRDFQHYYCKPWLDGIASRTPLTVDAVSCPAIHDRGLWTWQYACYDPYAYIDRASQWKLNTIIFWNRGVPMDADRLTAYAHRRGVKIWWGFSWGWTAEDFRDANPELAKRLTALWEKQKREISPGLQNLDFLAPETAPALKEYVLDVFERQYAWLPEIDGIYFQSATEAINPRLAQKSADLGRAFMTNLLPIVEELHRRRPGMRISAGIHNTGTYETYEALKQLPAYCNILWESGKMWAPGREMARKQMTLRGSAEDYAGVYRITMNCGMIFQDQSIQGEKDRAWLPRVEKLWAYLEEGRRDGPGKAWPFCVDGKEVGYPCAVDWRPPAGQRLVDNANFRELLLWSKDLAQGPPRGKGIFLLVEAGLPDLKMRRVPAMAAEAIWNPTADEAELERRCRLIWEKRVGGWDESANPFWRGNGLAPQSRGTGSPTGDPGAVYKEVR